jgi:uncharacterized damage-inducible protein DinB
VIFETRIDQYVAGPELLARVIRGMTDEQLDRTPVPGRWSTRQVVAHIADFEPVYADRMKRIIAEDEPTFFGGDPDVFAEKLAYDKREIEEELDLIRSVRRHMARILRAQDPSVLQRIGNHSVDGPLTLEVLLERITGHIPHHVAFIHQKREAMSC